MYTFLAAVLLQRFQGSTLLPKPNSSCSSGETHPHTKLKCAPISYYNSVMLSPSLGIAIVSPWQQPQPHGHDVLKISSGVSNGVLGDCSGEKRKRISSSAACLLFSVLVPWPALAVVSPPPFPHSSLSLCNWFEQNLFARAESYCLSYSWQQFWPARPSTTRHTGGSTNSATC